MSNYADREPRVIEIAHPAVILGRLTEKLYRLEEYAQWKADENLIEYSGVLLRLALELQTSILELDKFKQRVELERQLIASVEQEREALRCEKTGGGGA